MPGSYSSCGRRTHSLLFYRLWQNYHLEAARGEEAITCQPTATKWCGVEDGLHGRRVFGLHGAARRWRARPTAPDTAPMGHAQHRRAEVQEGLG